MISKYDTKVFVVEDNPFYSEMIQEQLHKSGIRDMECFKTGDQFLNNLHKMPEIVVMDQFLEDHLGIDLLKEVKAVNPDIQVIFISAENSFEMAINSLKYGAFDYIIKDDDTLDNLDETIKKAQRFLAMVKAKSKLKSHLFKAMMASMAFAIVALIGSKLWP